MRETGERAGRGERFPPSLLMSQKKGSLHYSVCLGLYTTPKQYKLPKSTKSVNCYKDKMGRNQKRNKKAKIQTDSRNSVAGLKSEQCAGDLNCAQEMGSFATYEILQFHNPTKIPAVFHFSHFFLFFPSKI